MSEEMSSVLQYVNDVNMALNALSNAQKALNAAFGGDEVRLALLYTEFSQQTNLHLVDDFLEEAIKVNRSMWKHVFEQDTNNSADFWNMICDHVFNHMNKPDEEAHIEKTKKFLKPIFDAVDYKEIIVDALAIVDSGVVPSPPNNTQLRQKISSYLTDEVIKSLNFHLVEAIEEGVLFNRIDKKDVIDFAYYSPSGVYMEQITWLQKIISEFLSNVIILHVIDEG